MVEKNYVCLADTVIQIKKNTNKKMTGNYYFNLI